MEEKIKEIINSRAILNKLIVDEFASALLDLFEQEKQAYAKDMCERAYQAGYNKGSKKRKAIYPLYMTKEEWIQENFPEK